MSRESIENLWSRATPVEPLLDAYRNQELALMADRLERENPDRGADFSAGVDWAIATIRSTVPDAL